jgi:Family of unknown function (DUF5996)
VRDRAKAAATGLSVYHSRVDDMAPHPAWPELTLSEWQGTRNTLHLWTQIVGTVRLALAQWSIIDGKSPSMFHQRAHNLAQARKRAWTGDAVQPFRLRMIRRLRAAEPFARANLDASVALATQDHKVQHLAPEPSQ